MTVALSVMAPGGFRTSLGSGIIKPALIRLQLESQIGLWWWWGCVET